MAGDNGWYQPPRVTNWLTGDLKPVDLENCPTHTTDQGKEYKLAQFNDGRVVRVYASGTVIDHERAGEKGSIIEGATAHRITTANTHEKRNARIERTRALLRDEIINQVERNEGIPADSRDAPESYAVVVGRLLGDVIEGRGDVNQRRLFLDWLGRASDLLPGDGQDEGSGVNALTDAVDRIAGILGAGGRVGIVVEGGNVNPAEEDGIVEGIGGGRFVGGGDGRQGDG